MPKIPNQLASLTLLSVSLLSLAACQSNDKAVRGEKAQSSQVESAPSTQSSTPAQKTETSQTKAAIATETSPSKSNAQPARETNQVLSQQTDDQPATQISPATSPKTPPTPTQTTPLTENQPTTTTISETQVQPTESTSPTLLSVSPGAAAGQWDRFLIRPNGTISETPIIITSNTTHDNGVIYLDFTDTLSGFGGYIHYYPAGVPIPFENFQDPTDISQDRLITGSGGYIGVAEDDFDRLILKDISYRV